MITIKLETLQSCARERPRYMPKAAAMHYVYVCHSCKSRSWSVEKQRMQRLPRICHSAKYERSSSRHWRTGTGKPKSRSRRFDLFCECQSHVCHLPCGTIPSCMTVHDNVAVAVIVSEVWAFKVFLFNCVSCTKVG